jgi:hypothetical protein
MVLDSPTPETALDMAISYERWSEDAPIRIGMIADLRETRFF